MPGSDARVAGGRRWMSRIVATLAVQLVLAGTAAAIQTDNGTDAALAAAPDISLLTFGPGEIYWERFGHNAIVVRDPVSGHALSYNYGIFDFEEDDFFVNFLRGHMRYQMAANDADDDIAIYAAQGRFVVEQQLRFAPDQARALAAFLEWNRRPENVHYRYEYFTSNCSTKVRDALDDALGGALRAQLTSPSRGYTFRLLTAALTSPQPLLMGVLDAGLGPYADRRLSFWDDSFIPMQLMAHLREIQVPEPDGRMVPLVVAERMLAPARLRAPPELPPDLRWPFLGAGVALAAILLALARRRHAGWARRSFAVLAVVLTLVCALSGSVMLGLWGFTDHLSAWRNENLFVFSPLCLLLVPTWWRAYAPGWSPSASARAITLMISVLAGFGLFAKVLPWFAQSNVAWLLLLLPVHLALAWIAWHPHARARFP